MSTVADPVTDAEVAVVCARPTCRATFTASAGRGRPRLYCSDACRRRAQLEREAALVRVASLEDQLRRERHYLAAFATPTTTTTEETGP